MNVAKKHEIIYIPVLKFLIWGIYRVTNLYNFFLAIIGYIMDPTRFWKFSFRTHLLKKRTITNGKSSNEQFLKHAISQ